jgi:hypothetical protein
VVRIVSDTFDEDNLSQRKVVGPGEPAQKLGVAELVDEHGQDSPLKTRDDGRTSAPRR